MSVLDLDSLLSRPDLTEAVAPWCKVLSNLELALVMAAQPGLGVGMRRAELERRVRTMASGLGVGPTYFQRINRSVAALVERGVFETVGKGRARAFRVAPEGFAALILNLLILKADPTVDGSEFELKRSVVALWNAVHQELLSWDVDIEDGTEFEAFLDDVEKVAVWGQRVITDEVVARAFNIFSLIDLQRDHVSGLIRDAERNLERVRRTGEWLGSASSDAVRQVESALGDGVSSSAEILQAVAAAASAPKLEAQVLLARYRAYLAYLDQLQSLYAAELQVVDLQHLRARYRGGATRS